MVYLNPSISRWNAWGAIEGRRDNKIQEIALSVLLASALTTLTGRQGVRPLGTVHEPFWTDKVGIPKWDHAPLRYENVFEGRTTKFSPADFAHFHHLIMGKMNMSETQCKALPAVIVMTRGKVAQHDGGRGIINIDEVIAATRQVYSITSMANQLGIFDFAKLNIEKQISLAICAKVLIAPHGGGLTHAHWMSPGSRVVELLPHGSNQCGKSYRANTPMGTATTDFHRFSLGAGHHYDCLKSRESAEPPGSPKTSWRNHKILVNIDDLEEVLRLTKSESVDRMKRVIAGR